MSLGLQVMSLRSRFLVMSRRADAERSGKDVPDAEGAEFDDSEDTAKGMARLFAEVGECYVGLIAAGTLQ